jgi:dihydrofolate synthase/folylpolyglutamate synthase
MLEVLAPYFAHAYLTRYTNNVRAAAPEPLAEWLHGHGFAATVCPTPADAWQAARAEAGPADLVCVAGSVFLAGELRPLLLREGGAES